MTDFVERRNNRHTQMLVEVGIRLCRFRGRGYALKFLRDVHVPDGIIERVLREATSHAALQGVRHVTYHPTEP